MAEVWLDSRAGLMRVLQCRLDGAYLDLLYADGKAWLLESVDGGVPSGAVGPFPCDAVVPDPGWFASLGLRSPGQGPLHGIDCDWWVGLTACTNQPDPDMPPVPPGQLVANWFWLDHGTGLPLQMMFINKDNSYRLPVLGDFAKVTFTRSESISDPGLSGLLGLCDRARAPEPGSAVGTAADRASLFASQPGMAGRLLPGLRAPRPDDQLPVWPQRLYLTSFSIATFDALPNAPYPTQVYYDDARSRMLTRMQLQDGATEDCALSQDGASVILYPPHGKPRIVARLPVGLPYPNWAARDDATVIAAIDRDPLLCPDSTLLLISAPSTLGRSFWIWYTSAGQPVSFLEAPQCANVQLVLTEYAEMIPVSEPFDPDPFGAPTAFQEH